MDRTKTLAEPLRIAMESRAMPPQACERVTVDTTVETKAVAHPADSHLLMRGIEWLNRLARKHGLQLPEKWPQPETPEQLTCPIYLQPKRKSRSSRSTR